jgi:hypothetical protein
LRLKSRTWLIEQWQPFLVLQVADQQSPGSRLRRIDAGGRLLLRSSDVDMLGDSHVLLAACADGRLLVLPAVGAAQAAVLLAMGTR